MLELSFVSGYQGNSWRQKSLEISTAPGLNIRIEFESMRRNDDPSYICVDDVMITTGSCK